MLYSLLCLKGIFKFTTMPLHGHPFSRVWFATGYALLPHSSPFLYVPYLYTIWSPCTARSPWQVLRVNSWFNLNHTCVVPCLKGLHLSPCMVTLLSVYGSQLCSAYRLCCSKLFSTHPPLYLLFKHFILCLRPYLPLHSAAQHGHPVHGVQSECFTFLARVVRRAIYSRYDNCVCVCVSLCVFFTASILLVCLAFIFYCILCFCRASVCSLVCVSVCVCKCILPFSVLQFAFFSPLCFVCSSC